MMSKSNISTLISKLNNDLSEKVILNSLQSIKSEFIKQKSGCKQIAENNGIPKLLSLLECTVSNRILDLALSVLADCMLQLDEIRVLVRKSNGVNIIVNILKSQQKNVLNRGARALANLALNSENIATIHKHNAGPLLIMLLRDSSDPGTQESLTRAIRILADNVKHQALLVKFEGLRPIVKHLQSNIASVISQCVRALSELTNNCSPAAAIQVLEEGGIPGLLHLTSHNKSVIKEHAFTSLINLMKHSSVRASVGSANGIAVFLKGLKYPKEKVFSLHLHALCLCCQEAVNRAKLKDVNGLKILIDLLKDSEHCSDHERIILALECFYFDEDALELFGNSGLVQILIDKLLSLEIQHEAISEHDTEMDEVTVAKINQSAAASELGITKKTSKVTSIFDIDDDEEERKPSCSSKADSSQPMLHQDCEFDQFRRKPYSYSPVSIDLASFLRNEDREHRSSMSPSSEVCYSPCFSMSPPTYEYSPATSPQLSPGGSDYSLPSTSKLLSGSFEELNKDYSNIDNSDTAHKTRKRVSSTDGIDSESWNEFTRCNKKMKLSDADERQYDLNDLKSSFTFWRVEQEELNAMEKKSQSTTTDISFTESSKSTSTVARLKGKEYGLLLLLSRFSHKNDLCKFLLTVDCFKVLLKIMLQSKNMKYITKCRRIVVRLLHNPLCFEDIIMLGIPTLIKQNLDNSETPSSKTVRKYWPPAEILEHLLHYVSLQTDTVFGESLIENLMSSALEHRRFACCRAIPFLCRFHKTQKKVLHDLNGLKLYREFLKLSHNDDILEATVVSLKQLAQVVGVKDPVITMKARLEKQTQNNSTCCCYEKNLKDADIQFILDDNSRLCGSRSLLSKSEVFSAMLTGNFKESKQSNVSVADVSRKTFEFILHRLYGCSNCTVMSSFVNCRTVTDTSVDRSSEHVTKSFTKNFEKEDISDTDVATISEICIEAMVVTDRFLLHDIKNYVYKVIISDVLCGDTALSLYTYSKQYEYKNLCQATLEHVLCDSHDNLLTFKGFLHSDNPSAIDEMFSLILQNSTLL